MSIHQLQTFSSIQERDVDMLVVEELSANEEFASWLVARTWGLAKFASIVKAWHSVNVSAHGESDIVFVFQDRDGHRYSILIENKINAAAQPNQAERYRIRAAEGKATGDWSEARTCVIAPRRYLDSERHEGVYDDQISYEELMAFFASRSARDRRYAHKAEVLSEAIEQNRRGPIRIVSVEVTRYYREYYLAAIRALPELEAQKPGERAAGNTWAYFTPAGYPPEVQLVHQASGYVKLFFNGQASLLDEIRSRLAPALGESLRPEATGKSVAVSIPVARLTPTNGEFEKDAVAAQQAFEALRKLDRAYRTSYLPAPLRAEPTSS